MPNKMTLCAVVLSLLACAQSHAATETAFVAKPSYSVLVAGISVPVDLASVPRGFDFSGYAPFVNAYTLVSDIATINYWDSTAAAATVLNSTKIKTLNGAPGHVFKVGAYTAVGYRKGDGLVEGTLRTMLNSYAIPTRKVLAWDLVFMVGGATPTTPWTFTPKGTSPATLWQIKSSSVAPALVMAVDTDPADPTSLQLSFDQRLNPTLPGYRVADVNGLKPNTDIQVRIELATDDRPISSGGTGYLVITVNGKEIHRSLGPVLQGAATTPYQWSLAMYLWNNKAPLAFDRFGFWKRATMSVIE